MVTEQPKYNPIENIPVEKRHTWKQGESGNPGGRPKDPGITKLQIEMLDKPCPYSKGTWREWLAERGLVLASEKEMALEHLKERLEGKVKQDIGLEGDIPVNIIYKLKENDAT